MRDGSARSKRWKTLALIDFGRLSSMAAVVEGVKILISGGGAVVDGGLGGFTGAGSSGV